MDNAAEVFLTAYQALVTNAAMKDVETVLIHAVCLMPLACKPVTVVQSLTCCFLLFLQGASGVGLAATQLAKVLFKATKVIATAGKTAS